MLRALPTPHGTLSDEVDAWIQAGKDLGDVERRRIQLSETRDEETVSSKEVNQARRRWNLVAETVLQIVSLLQSIDEETRTRITQPLKTAEEKADHAQAESRAKNRVAEIAATETQPNETNEDEGSTSTEEAV